MSPLGVDHLLRQGVPSQEHDHANRRIENPPFHRESRIVEDERLLDRVCAPSRTLDPPSVPRPCRKALRPQRFCKRLMHVNARRVRVVCDAARQEKRMRFRAFT